MLYLATPFRPNAVLVMLTCLLGMSTLCSEKISFFAPFLMKMHFIPQNGSQCSTLKSRPPSLNLYCECFQTLDDICNISLEILCTVWACKFLQVKQASHLTGVALLNLQEIALLPASLSRSKAFTHCLLKGQYVCYSFSLLWQSCTFSVDWPWIIVWVKFFLQIGHG